MHGYWRTPYADQSLNRFLQFKQSQAFCLFQVSQENEHSAHLTVTENQGSQQTQAMVLWRLNCSRTRHNNSCNDSNNWPFRQRTEFFSQLLLKFPRHCRATRSFRTVCSWKHFLSKIYRLRARKDTYSSTELSHLLSTWIYKWVISKATFLYICELYVLTALSNVSLWTCFAYKQFANCPGVLRSVKSEHLGIAKNKTTNFLTQDLRKYFCTN